jgi:hypothetical protein
MRNGCEPQAAQPSAGSFWIRTRGACKFELMSHIREIGGEDP